MSKRRTVGRLVNGLLIYDKPPALSSNQALQEVKRLFFARKAGHGGSLDPLATGMLIICLGEATKFSQFLLEADKQYTTTAQLGVQTTTGDSEGDVVETRPIPSLTHAQVEKVLAQFRGKISQVPSMYSALKYQGKPLYEYARKGIDIARESRDIMIYDLQLVELTPESLRLSIRCSKGTYIRTLVEDIGKAIGCGAHVSALRRDAIGPFSAEQMVTREQIQKAAEQSACDQYLIPTETLVQHWPSLNITSMMAFYMQQGHAVQVPKAPTSGWVRLNDKSGQFIGVGEVLPDGRIGPKRILKTTEHLV
ncbi:MAG TPA: tRNA pseudouridine(55) synthase TruB [Coxiellaceae bacterium]|nr:tRNA pseudouridine(55) synthase TruB [Coxiellaceae bacterium]